MADDTVTEETTTTPGTDETPAPSQPASTTATPSSENKDEIPPALKSVIDKERRAAREAEKRAKQFESELNKLKETQMSEHEKAVKAARDEGLSEGVKTGNERLLRAEIIAAASGKVADPEDAYAILMTSGALSGISVGEAGDVDTSAIKSAIDDLVKAKPHLAAHRDPTFGARKPADAAPATTDQLMDQWIRSQAK